MFLMYFMFPERLFTGAFLCVCVCVYIYIYIHIYICIYSRSQKDEGITILQLVVTHLEHVAMLMAALGNEKTLMVMHELSTAPAHSDSLFIAWNQSPGSIQLHGKLRSKSSLSPGREEN